MPRPQPDANPSSHRLWLIIAGVLIVLAFFAIQSRTDPNAKSEPPGRRSEHSHSGSEPTNTPPLTKLERFGPAATPFPTRIWTVPADFTMHLFKHGHSRKDPDDPFRWDPYYLPRPLKYHLVQEYLKREGIPFPSGTAARIDLNTGKLEVSNTPSNLDLAEALFTRLAIEESKARAGH